MICCLNTDRPFGVCIVRTTYACMTSVTRTIGEHCQVVATSLSLEILEWSCSRETSGQRGTVLNLWPRSCPMPRIVSWHQDIPTILSILISMAIVAEASPHNEKINWYEELLIIPYLLFLLLYYYVLLVTKNACMTYVPNTRMMGKQVVASLVFLGYFIWLT